MGSSQSTEHDIPQKAYEPIYQRRRFPATPQRPVVQKTVEIQTQTEHVYKKPVPSAPECSQRPPVLKAGIIDPQQTKIQANEPSIPHLSSKDSKFCCHPRNVEENHQQKINQLYPSIKKIDDTPLNKKIVDDHKVIEGIPMRPVRRKSLCKPPDRLNDLDEFMKNWNIWKEQFASFLTVMDENKTNYRNWGYFLLNFMGPVGQQILNRLFFDKEDDKKDYVILVRKYNSFYEFNKTIKTGGESVAEYIERLKSEAAQNLRNVDETLKEKLAKDIQKLHEERFIALASSMIPNFKFETTFKSLSLAEIAFLWKNCEESNFVNNGSCKLCGKFHPKDKCFAVGKECNKCRRRGHFAKYCPGLMFINNCSFCGGDHGHKQCPAYGEQCSKCSRMHHFSWKCSKDMVIRNCRFCNIRHPMDRDKCPAKNSLCSICRKRGHYEMKCDERKTS